MIPSNTLSSPLVQCENLVKIYKVDELEVVALQGLDLEIRSGEFLAIVGASGSGKSSLLNMLGGLDRPSAGRVTVAEMDLLKLSDAELARYRLEQVGFVWQQSSRNLIPYLTAQENVELPMLAADSTSEAATAYAQELLEAVDLSDRRDHRLAQLSGGQQQRVAIAVALANRPQLLLADEPTGEVDSATAQTIWKLLRQLNQRYGLTTIIVTHDRNITHVVDRVVSIRDGKTSTETVRQSQRSRTFAENATGMITEEDSITAASEPHFEERTVLDAAGRLQLPRDYLEQRGITSRALVQLVDNGILIQATGDEMSVQSVSNNATELDTEITEEAQNPTKEKREGAWWRRLLGFRVQPSGMGSTETGAADRQIDYSIEQFKRPELAENGVPLVEAKGLNRVYRVGDETIHALRNVELTIERQQLAIFRGRSGSGKTTLLNLLGGLDHPTSGQVSLFGQDLYALSEEQCTELRRDRIGFVFQSFALIPTFSALENVEMLLRAQGMDETERCTRALHCLTQVGLYRWADHRPFELSGGQQQRLSIARALAHRPQIIIADEPTSDLDSETGYQVMALFQQLVEEEGFTILMASHDPTSDEFATEVYELSDGQISNNAL